jgi:hypothetical protein
MRKLIARLGLGLALAALVPETATDGRPGKRLTGSGENVWLV